MAKEKAGLFRRLTKLFRSGPVIKRRVRGLDDSGVSSAFELFKKNQSAVYSSAMSAYGTYDRLARYSDFSEMEYTPEISSALDIYSEETVAADENGKVLHIHSENATITKLLGELFYDTLNVEFNLTPWARNLVKYGDFFLFNDVDPKYGVINAYPMPISEVEREEGFDPKDPMAVRFRWITQGNQPLENWQVCHMRLMGNDAFLPYGSSVLESARRIWRQLILIEDAMLVYRIVRSPERRVFKIDVGNVPPEDIPNYMEQVQTQLKRAQIVDKNTGRVDLRYNPLSVDEDYFLPVRGGESGTSIESLPGGANATAIEDVEYIQKKLFAALKIPKAYLGYDEGLGAKATLAQEDIRFSRAINKIQRTIISELNKILTFSNQDKSSFLIICRGATEDVGYTCAVNKKMRKANVNIFIPNPEFWKDNSYDFCLSTESFKFGFETGTLLSMVDKDNLFTCEAIIKQEGLFLKSDKLGVNQEALTTFYVPEHRASQLGIFEDQLNFFRSLTQQIALCGVVNNKTFYKKFNIDLSKLTGFESNFHPAFPVFRAFKEAKIIANKILNIGCLIKKSGNG